MRITVLGAGLIGRIIARELASEEETKVSVFDADEAALERVGRETHASVYAADLSRPEAVSSAVAQADAVVGALPGALGSAMLRAVIEAGKPIADISFSRDDPLQLETLAREKGVTAVVDCGVSPGLSNFFIGRAARDFNEVDDARIYVGGLPFVRHWPFEYAAVFSPADVVEEYTRPARIFEEGRLVTRPALSEVERIEVPGVGTLEAFLTDGLRTLLRTVPARTMKEKTLRYPGHAEKMEILREVGFFDETLLELRGGVRFAPRDVTEHLLSRAWQLGDEFEEFTYLKVIVTGRKLGRTLRTRFELFDRTHRASGTTSMARTTAFPCLVIARMLARGEYRDPGVRPLEMLAANREAAARFELGMTARGMHWTKESHEVEPV
ncbi:MAG TPA: saccharopine dehydrogenase C-terminal domain-containing protein [Thermoanaerobaculia bacterium]|jgi:saccharopine dehydrogenase-like NADP-dependent oxidoreductase|nr:saccharopine dehydrogenase C-terminal domain-containing protein [Thermoanaerobaculia bacterium]